MKRDTDARLDIDHPLDPQWLGRRFLALGPSVAGTFTKEDLKRLGESVLGFDGPVQWQLSLDQTQADKKARGRFWLFVSARAVLRCERCLEPVTEPLSLKRGFEFAASLEQADEQTLLGLQDAPLDGEKDEVDLLAPQDGVCLRDLIEDELLLGLPVAPKHKDCKAPAGPDALAADPQETTRPFADLKTLIKKGSGRA